MNTADENKAYGYERTVGTRNQHARLMSLVRPPYSTLKGCCACQVPERTNGRFPVLRMKEFRRSCECSILPDS